MAKKPEEKLVTKAELAEIVGKSERTLTTWQKNGMPIRVDGNRGSSNLYSTAAVIEWMIQQEIKRKIAEHGGGDAEFFDYEAERARLTFHQANKADLEEQVLRGKLIPSETVERVWSDMVASFRSRVLAVPTKAAHQFLALDDLNAAQDLLKEHLHEALRELSDYEPDQYDLETIEESGIDGGAAARDEGQRLGGRETPTIQ